jgi:Na+/proline symporter/signal transduction histidine kinase
MSQYLGTPWLVSLVSLLYVGFLFVIASHGSRVVRNRWQPYIYSLTLAIFCTTWAFYGTVQQALVHGWILAPTYAGAIVLITLGWKIMDRIVRVARQENSTTISDFIAARYGHSRGVGVLVALLCLLGVVPYIALQLKAVSGSFQLLTNTTAIEFAWYSDPTLLIAAIMAVFSILFGTRTVDSSESHQGMMLAIAFESLVKLVALTAVGLYAVYGIYDGFADLINTAMAQPQIARVLTDYSDPSVYLTHALLGGIAIIALPRHFHVAVVEYRSERDLRVARWMFPLYLVAINLFILPLGLTALLSQDMLSSFGYITLELPLAFGQHWLALLAYIGGLSAGTSMVIISSITLATMMCNDIILPLFIKYGLQAAPANIRTQVLGIRRLVITLVLLLAFMYYRLLSQFHSLSEIGLLAFVAIAQFAPAILIGLIWQGANRMGACWAISCGFIVWFYTLFLPLAGEIGWTADAFMNGPWGLDFLRPHALLGLNGLNPIVHGTFWSLLVNCLVLVIASLYYKPGFADQEQAQRFAELPAAPVNRRNTRYLARNEDLRALLQRFIAPAKIRNLFDDFAHPLSGRLMTQGTIDDDTLKAADRLLSSVVGRKGSDLLLRNLVEHPGGQSTRLNHLVDEVSEVVLFNRDLMHAVLHSLQQGITVVDENLNIVAWNQHFAGFYNFPPGLLYVGQSAETVARFIAGCGGYGEGDVETLVKRRMNEVEERKPLIYVRKAVDGRYIELRGQPISGNRYITAYTDITEHRAIQVQLQQANDILEQRVEERTLTLTRLNEDLQKANRNKTRFLAAAGHDLVQPLNSASLFSASVINRLERQRVTAPDLVNDILPVARHLDQSLHSAESLLNELLEISKLDADIVKPRRQVLAVANILDSLVGEFQPLARQKGIRLRYVYSSASVDTDPVLLRRVLQNLLSNALRYTQQGHILVGTRRRGESLEVQVLDTGPGIPEQELEMIFEEFHRLPAAANPPPCPAGSPAESPLIRHQTSADSTPVDPPPIDSTIIENSKGLGLGLSIVRRVCRLLDHPLRVQSKPGRGSCFAVSLPVRQPSPETTGSSGLTSVVRQDSGRVLCIDNEQQIVDGMRLLLSDWGYEVITAMNLEQARQAINHTADKTVDLVIIDYHLDQGLTGLNLMQTLNKELGQNLPALVISADYTEEVKQGIEAQGYPLLRKPVKPMALRAMLNRLL